MKSADVAPLDTTNRFMVTAKGERVVQQRLQAYLTREEALQLASWLIVMAECVDSPRGESEALEIVRATVRVIQKGD